MRRSCLNALGKGPGSGSAARSSILALITLTKASGLLLPHFGGTPLLVAQRVHPGEQVLRAHIQGSSRWAVAGGIAQWCGAPSSGPLCFHSTEALLWLWDSMPASLLGALGLSLLRWPLAGRPSMASDAQYCYFRPDPCIVQAGQYALVLCPPPRAGCPLPPWLQGQRGVAGGGSTRPLCPAGVLKLQDSVNLVPLAQQGCSSSSILRNVSGS